MATKNDIFDILIIGGGITGAGVLRASAQKGLNTLLLEKNDFASGTSSKSAKLVHGGLRYLQHLQLKIVRESLIERNWLLESYPHLVKPIEFVMPLYGSSFKYRIAMVLYQMMGKHKILPKYQFFDKTATIDKYSGINTKGLKGSFSYYDGITNDARLVSEMIFEAEQYPNISAKNYIKVTKIEDHKNHSIVYCIDSQTGEQLTYKTKVVVNCTGPWADETLNKFQSQSQKVMEPSKGVHLVFSQDKFPITSAYAFSSGANDGRMFYALPWENNTVILGPTDTTFKGDFDGLTTDKDDVAYLLNGLNQFSPKSNFTKDDILSSFVGLRPLFNEEGESKDKTRDFKIWWSSDTLVSISGGKLTTFRAMGNALVDNVITKKEIQIKENKLNKPKNITDTLPQQIKNNYGLFAQKRIQEIIDSDSQNTLPIIEELKILKAEVIFSIRFLHAKTIDDIMLRRFSFNYGLKQKPYYENLKKEIELILNSELNRKN